MSLKRNIPEPILSLSGQGIGFGDHTIEYLDREILPGKGIRTQPPAIPMAGNRCGHDRKNPRYFERPPEHRPRPSILEEAIEKLTSVFRHPKKFLTGLNTLNPKSRQKRSERREATVAVAQVLMHYLDLSTLSVGFPTASGTFLSLDLKYIAKQAGLSLMRARRAVCDLVKAGYIRLTRQFDQKEEGGFVGLPSIRQLSVRFFADLGIDPVKLNFMREWKRKKQEKAEARKGIQKLKDTLRAVTDMGGNAARALKRAPAPSVRCSASGRASINRALAMHRADPTRSPSEYLREIEQPLK